MSEIKREFVFKLVLMGEGSVGKTSIRSKFMGAGFKSEYIKTIGADFASKAITLGENKVHFQIWDLAGQKMYKHVRSSFYSGCKCGFLVFDLTQPETLTMLENWVDEAIKHSGGFLKIFIIVGNKSDLKDQIKVNKKDVDKLLKKINDIQNIESSYIETSAKTGENIQEAFEMMGKMFLEKEGFPSKGQGSEIDDEILTHHHQEMVNLFSVTDARSPNPSNKENKKSTDGKIEDFFNTIEMLNERINRLAQITAALEERLLLIETKDDNVKDLKKDISSLKNKIEKIDVEIEESFTDSDSEDFNLRVPVPDFDDLSNENISTDNLESDIDISIDVNEEVDFIQDLSDEHKSLDDKNENIKNSQPRCPKCGSKLAFIKQYNRWYCYNCKKYS